MSWTMDDARESAARATLGTCPQCGNLSDDGDICPDCVEQQEWEDEDAAIDNAFAKLWPPA